VSSTATTALAGAAGQDLGLTQHTPCATQHQQESLSWHEINTRLQGFGFKRIRFIQLQVRTLGLLSYALTTHTHSHDCCVTCITAYLMSVLVLLIYIVWRCHFCRLTLSPCCTGRHDCHERQGCAGLGTYNARCCHKAAAVCCAV
jgi:hypothetical protein